MSMRTTKTERRAARRQCSVECQWFGTARVARILRRGPTGRWALLLARALAVPPEAIIAGNAGSYWGQYWPPTGDVVDAPYRPRLPAPLTQAMAEICDDLARTMLHPGLRRIGVENPEQYTIGFELAGADLKACAMPGAPLAYEPPQPSTPWEFELPAGWGQP
jgi:hypothetical protein